MSLLSCPAPFKPTLVSEYFFSEPPSPSVGGAGVAPTSSPEVESPHGNSSSSDAASIMPQTTQVQQHQSSGHRAKKHTPAYAAIPEGGIGGGSGDSTGGVPVLAEMDLDCSDPPCCEDLLQTAPQEPGELPLTYLNPEDAEAWNQKLVPGPTTATMSLPPVPLPDVSTGSPTIGAVHPTPARSLITPPQQHPTPPVSGHSIKVHQRLLDAAMADQAPQPPLLPAEDPHRSSVSVRKDSAASANDSAFASFGTGSAYNSSSNSPTSPHSDTQMSTSLSQQHTPSPPPLALPQAAAHPPPPQVVTDAVIYSQQQQHRAPASSPTRYRTVVPAAASHISPVVVPAPAPYNSTQHARTPQTHSTHSHSGSRSHTVAHSTPATPQAHSSSGTHHAPPGHVRKISGGDSNAEYVGPFILGPVLGRGCTGTVRLGTHKTTRFEVAFKIIEKKYLIGDVEGGTAAGNATSGAPVDLDQIEQSKLWKKVKREIVILKLIEHPHVLKLYDVLETENRLYLVLEHVQGGELFDYIVSKGRLDRTEALRICAQIIMGLEHCHSHGICHRDLKPENLLLTKDCTIKIADFGMAQLMKKDGILKTSCGSPHYAAPEVVEGKSYDAKCTDMWSCGVILYALITGSLPFDHDNIPTLLTMVTRGHYTTPAHVPADIAHLISRMLTVDPTKRITIPEVRRHICFKGTNFFTPIDSSAHDALARKSIGSGVGSAAGAMKDHSGVTLPPHKKRAKVGASNNNASHGIDADDSDEEPSEHAHRKKSHDHGVSGAAAGGAVAGADNSVHFPFPAPFQPMHPHSHSHSHSVTGPLMHHHHSGHHHSSRHAMAGASSGLVDEDVIDDAVLNDLESLGLGPKDGNREELKKKIRSTDASGKEPSLEQVFYKLLKRRKMDRLKELAVLSPKISPAAAGSHRSRRMQHAHREGAHSSHHHSVIKVGEGAYVASQPTSATMVPLPGPALVFSSQPTSQVTTPSGIQHDDPLVLAELTLPPPASRPSPGAAAQTSSSVMVDVMSSSAAGATVGHYHSGTSIMSQSPHQPSSPSLLQSSIFGVQHTVSTPADHGASKMQIDGQEHTLHVSSSTGTTSASTIPANAAPLFNSEVTPRLPSTSPPLESPPHVVAPPPMRHTQSDGGVPESIMNDEDSSASAYYRSTAALPTLDLQESMRPTLLPPASPSSSLSFIPDSAPLSSRDGTAPVTPVDRMSASFTNTGNYEDLKPSPPSYGTLDMGVPELPSLPPPTSSSASVSPMVTPHRQTIYQRRMSTPQTHTGPAFARQLFLDEQTQPMTPLEQQEQAALDRFAAGPTLQSMDMDSSAQSAPMTAQAHLVSPPLLSLPPRVTAPHIHVRVSDKSSDSESERERGDAPAHPHPHPHSMRARAYSQDETAILARHPQPSDSVMSNIHTPISGGGTGGALPTYTSSPRFHRVKLNDAASSSSSGARSGSIRPGAVGSSSRTMPAGVQPPPSPQAKRSWFSSVFGSAGFNFLDRLKGKRSSLASGTATAAAAAAATAAAAAAASNPQGSPSPLLSPSTPRSSTAIQTKRATLTLTNDLSRLFQSSGVQFVHSRGYRFEASYQPHLPPQAFQTPPMPPMNMPPMQRAVSTPGEAAAQRPRSSSIAAEPKQSPPPSLYPQTGNPASSPAASRALTSREAGCETPKPIPTRSLHQPFIPSVLQYPMTEADESPVGLFRNLSNTSNASNVSESSVESSREGSATDLAAMAAAAFNTNSPSLSQMSSGAASMVQSPVTQQPIGLGQGAITSATASSSAASSGSVPTPRARAANSAVAAAAFGPGAVRFSVEIAEQAHDTRIVTFTRKSGDVLAFNRIVALAERSLHA